MRFLFIILLISLLFNQDRLSTILYNYENDLNNTKTHNNNSIKALLQSSVIPGSGQFFTNNQKTKGLIFFGIEILSLAGMSYYNKKADSFKSDYQDYGDQNWNFSTLDKCKIINETNKTLQCEVEFNRRLINKKSYGSAKGIWISTNRDGIWALQLRSMIPVSGTISSLAGTNMNSS